jgi:hypothetical protein
VLVHRARISPAAGFLAPPPVGHTNPREPGMTAAIRMRERRESRSPAGGRMQLVRGASNRGRAPPVAEKQQRPPRLSRSGSPSVSRPAPHTVGVAMGHFGSAPSYTRPRDVMPAERAQDHRPRASLCALGLACGGGGRRARQHKGAKRTTSPEKTSQNGRKKAAKSEGLDGRSHHPVAVRTFQLERMLLEMASAARDEERGGPIAGPE